jgi:PPOX class probable F420-dependent enzyme
MSDLKKRILNVIGKPHLAGLATVTEDGRPWVRYVMPVADEKMTIRFSTFLKARKVKHIEKNPTVHLVCGVTDPENWDNYVQIEGRAEVSTEKGEKKAFWNDELSAYFDGPDDPRYAVVMVKPTRIEFYSKEKMEMEVLEF